MSDQGQNSGNLCKNEAMPQIVTLNYPQGSLTGEQTTLLTHPYSQTLVHGQGSMYVSIYRWILYVLQIMEIRKLLDA